METVYVQVVGTLYRMYKVNLVTKRFVPNVAISLRDMEMTVMETTFKATEITAGFHLKGFGIDKTASPMNIYTKWHVNINGRWTGPKPVFFNSLPENLMNMNVTIAETALRNFKISMMRR